MECTQSPLTPLTSPLLDAYCAPGIVHGFFDRLGGVGSGPFAGLNVSLSVGDDEQTVLENREALKQCLGVDTLLTARQVHGEEIYCLSHGVTGDTMAGEADSLITNQPGVGLLIQQADCQGVLLYDPVRRVIGAVHCGWRGSVAGLIGATVSMMERVFDCRAVDMYGAVSPSLGPCCSEFVNHAVELPAEFGPFQVRQNYFDFWQISHYQLCQAGLRPEAVSVAAVCTSCSSDYFSYRRACREAEGVTGRNCSVIALSC